MMRRRACIARGGLQPGKSTLTESLASDGAPGSAAPGSAAPGSAAPGALPRLELRGNQLGPTAGPAVSPRAAPPPRMADAGDERKGNVNVAMKVVVRFDDGETRTWSGMGAWGDGLAERYTAARAGYRPEGAWIWEGDEAAQRAVASIRINDNLTGKSGIRPETWAKEQERLRAADERRRGSPGPAPFATTITVYAKRLDKVTNDPDAAPDEHAPGHVDKEDAGDGTGDEFKAKRPGAGSETEPGTSGVADGARDGARDGKAGGADGGTGTGAKAAAEQQAVSDFEDSIGIDASVETAHGGGDPDGSGDKSGGDKSSGQDQPGGDRDGRMGEDTEIGGTGPGGEDARRDGAGEGSKDGGSGGSEGGSRDGKQGGTDGGMYGGKGKPGDDGVPAGGGSSAWSPSPPSSRGSSSSRCFSARPISPASESEPRPRRSSSSSNPARKT